MLVTASPVITPRVASPQQSTGIRIYTHQEITPAWVNAAIVPVWESIYAGGRRPVALRRGWVGGPHVEVICVGPGKDDVDWGLHAKTVDVGSAPEVPVDPQDYLERARVRGRLENVAGPYLPLHAHGDVSILKAADVGWANSSLGRLNETAGAALAPATVHSVRTIAQSPEKLGEVIVSVLACVAQTHSLGAGFGTFSLRSHAEALLANWSPDGQLREEFSLRYQKQRTLIVPQVEQVLQGESGSHMTSWNKSLAYLKGVLEEAVRHGELTNALVDNAASASEASSPPPEQHHPDTEFHRAVYGSGVTDGVGEWFAGYRFLINSVYAQLPLAGVSPLKRAFGCWSVAEAVDEVLGESWTDRLAEGIQWRNES